jgi:hypothetical protein
MRFFIVIFSMMITHQSIASELVGYNVLKVKVEETDEWSKAWPAKSARYVERNGYLIDIEAAKVIRSYQKVQKQFPTCISLNISISMKERAHLVAGSSGNSILDLQTLKMTPINENFDFCSEITIKDENGTKTTPHRWLGLSPARNRAFVIDSRTKAITVINPSGGMTIMQITSEMLSHGEMQSKRDGPYFQSSSKYGRYLFFSWTQFQDKNKGYVTVFDTKERKITHVIPGVFSSRKIVTEDFGIGESFSPVADNDETYGSVDLSVIKISEDNGEESLTVSSFPFIDARKYGGKNSLFSFLISDSGDEAILKGSVSNSRLYISLEDGKTRSEEFDIEGNLVDSQNDLFMTYSYIGQKIGFFKKNQNEMKTIAKINLGEIYVNSSFLDPVFAKNGTVYTGLARDSYASPDSYFFLFVPNYK